MPNHCPDCGAEMEFESRPASVRIGTCADCGRASTMVEGTLSPAAPPAGAALPEGDGEQPICDNCGAVLAFRIASGDGVQAVCSGCHAVSHYVSAGSAVSAPRFRDRPPPRDDSRGEGRMSSSARPCRECGGALRFSTNEDGTTSAECTACGNRFTLPPRRDGDSRGPSRGRFGPPRGAGGRFGGRAGGGGGWGRGPPRGGAGGRSGSYSRRPSRDSDDSGDGDRRRDRKRRRDSD